MASHSSSTRTLAALTALTGGVLLVLAMQVVLTSRGLQIVDVWRDVIAGYPLSLRVASVWWLIAGSALIAGAAIARPLALFPAPWQRWRAPRWIIGALIVAALAHIGHGASVPEGISSVVFFMASGVAIIMGAAMALIGAVFALRA